MSPKITPIIQLNGFHMLLVEILMKLICVCPGRGLYCWCFVRKSA